ncbi:unnamed protein product [Camellia sinensis]
MNCLLVLSHILIFVQKRRTILKQLTAAVVSEGLRPALAGHSSSAPTGFPSLIQRCWDANPQNRPSFDDIILELDPILESFLLILQHTIQCCLGDPSVLVGEGRQWRTLTFLCPICAVRRISMCLESLMVIECAAAAKFSARALPGFLQSLGSIKSPSDALLEAFVKIDVAFRNELDSHRKSKGVIQKDWHPGCTAIVALIVRNKLFVANAGDCKAMLCRAGSAYALSKDHVASCPEERERIISEGGQVKWQVDTWRVGPAALQVTRSIGDDDLKPAVTAEPEIIETILFVDDEYL